MINEKLINYNLFIFRILFPLFQKVLKYFDEQLPRQMENNEISLKFYNPHSTNRCLHCCKMLKLLFLKRTRVDEPMKNYSEDI